MFKKKLNELLSKRLKNKEEFYKNQICIQNTKQYIEDTKLLIKLEFNTHLRNISKEEYKENYGNESKRKTALEAIMLSDDRYLKAFQADLNYKKEQLKVEHEDTLLKLQERYIFKEIDLYIAELQLKEKTCLDQEEKD